jgi:hypothetical protein
MKSAVTVSAAEALEAKVPFGLLHVVKGGEFSHAALFQLNAAIASATASRDLVLRTVPGLSMRLL